MSANAGDSLLVGYTPVAALLLLPSPREERAKLALRVGGGGSLHRNRCSSVCRTTPPPPPPPPPPHSGRGGGGGARRRNPCSSLCRPPPHPRPLPAMRKGAWREGRSPCMTSRSRRRFSREVCSLVRLPLKRGRRECRALDAPASRVCNGSGRAHTRSSGHTGFTRHPPRNGLRLISRSPRRPGFFATVARRVAPANLTPASGCQDHTISPSAFGALVRSATRVHRIPPRVDDDGQRPSVGRDGLEYRGDLYSGKQKYFC